jgi:hypothetical protein
LITRRQDLGSDPITFYTCDMKINKNITLRYKYKCPVSECAIVF